MLTRVVFEDQELSYAQLNARANQLGNYLRALGVKPETLVGLCVDRSVELVVGMLGILKAGGAYLPLDPNYPTERFDFILHDAACAWAITKQHLESRIPSTGARVLVWSAEQESLAQQSTANPGRRADPSNLAYVIFNVRLYGQA